MTTAAHFGLRWLAGETVVGDTVLADGSIWSHAATFGEYVYDGEPMRITPEKVDNFIRVFNAGHRGKVPVDYEHDTVRLSGAGKRPGPIPKAGDIFELRTVRTVAELPEPAKAQIEKAGRALDDPRNLGLWMRWRPTPRALQLIKDREVTELSVAFLEEYQDNRGEPQGPTLISVALTNTPYLDDMVPIAANRGSASSGDPADPGHEEKVTMKGLAMFSALFGRPVTSEDEVAEEARRAIETRDQTIRTLTQERDGLKALTGEIGETDPTKALEKVRTLKSEVAAAKQATEAEREKALTAQVDGILKTHEDRIVPAQKDYFTKALKAELGAGTKAGETPTEKMLAVMPKHGITIQHAGADTGESVDDLDKKIAALALTLVTEDPTLKALAARDPYAAQREATIRANRELRAK